MATSPITVKQIAKLLGISKSTVSRALQNQADVHAETRRKVVELAAKLDYEPNAIALHLKHKRTHAIGVIIPETTNAFFSRAVGGIQKIATSAGYNIMVCQSNESYATEKSNLKSLISNHVDGLLISVSRETKDTDHFDALLKKQIPVVFFDRICECLQTAQVVTDNYKISFEATQHLIEQGCRRIAILAGPQHLYTSAKRMEGYRDALLKNGVEYEPELLMYPDFRVSNIETFTRHLIRNDNIPDAIFAINDMAAIEIMHVLKKSGFKIPDDIAVMGFNNERISQFVEPSLSTIELPAHEMGAAAAQILLSHIQNPEHKPEKRLIPSTLIVRDSTKVRS